MRFFIDADLPRSVADALREFGHDAVDCRDVGLRSATDAAIFAHAQQHGMVVITGDCDFANILRYPPSAHQGVVTLRVPRGAGGVTIVRMLRSWLASLGRNADLTGCLCMVEAGRVRYRRRP